METFEDTFYRISKDIADNMPDELKHLAGPFCDLNDALMPLIEREVKQLVARNQIPPGVEIDIQWILYYVKIVEPQLAKQLAKHMYRNLVLLKADKLIKYIFWLIDYNE